MFLNINFHKNKPDQQRVCLFFSKIQKHNKRM